MFSTISSVKPRVFINQPSAEASRQNHWYTVRDIPLSDYQVLLKVNRRQLRCIKCRQVFSESLDFIKTRRTYTKRLAMKVIKEVLETNVESAAIVQENKYFVLRIKNNWKLEFEDATGLVKLGASDDAQAYRVINFCDLETKTE